MCLRILDYRWPWNGILSLLILHLSVPLVCLMIILVEATFIILDVVHYINIGSVDILQSSCVSIYPNSHGFVDACNFASVTRSHKINKVFVCA